MLKFHHTHTHITNTINGPFLWQFKEEEEEKKTDTISPFMNYFISFRHSDKQFQFFNGLQLKFEFLFL